MAPSSTRDVSLQDHMRHMTRILSQFNPNAYEHDFYEPVNEILVEFARSLRCEDFSVTTHPQAMFSVTEEENEDDSSTDASTEGGTSDASSSASEDSNAEAKDSDSGTEEEESGTEDGTTGTAHGDTVSIRSTESARAATPAAVSSNAALAAQQTPVLTRSPIVTTAVGRRKESARYPDFVCRMTSRQAFRRLLFIIEVKRFPFKYVYSLGPRKKNDRFPVLESTFNEARTQAFEQVQFAFERHPEEDEIRTMCIVGLIFEVHVYKRKSTPRVGEFSDKQESLKGSQCYVNRYGPYHIFNERFTGYTQAFKNAWKSAVTVKHDEVKRLLARGEKGAVAVNPLITYDFNAD